MKKCDDLCNKKNKFYKNISCKDECNQIKITLSVEFINNKIQYIVTNSGVVALRGDIFICSYYFGKIKIKNELLLVGEELNSLQDPINFLDYIDEFKDEKARAFINIKDRKFIYSNEIRKHFVSGVVFQIINAISGNFPGDGYTIRFTIANKFVSTMKAKNVRCTFPFTETFTPEALFNPIINHPDKGKFYIDYSGLHLEIYELDIGGHEEFTISFYTSIYSGKIYKWYSIIETDSPVLDTRSQIFQLTISL